MCVGTLTREKIIVIVGGILTGLNNINGGPGEDGT